jgi:hypothetical protein
MLSVNVLVYNFIVPYHLVGGVVNILSSSDVKAKTIEMVLVRIMKIVQQN